jgi:hypothetical protein
MIPKVLMALCLSGIFVLSANPQSQYTPDSKQVEDLSEAAFRYFFTSELAGSRAEAFCISSTKSLPLSFVKRFSDNDPPVVWSAECPFGLSKSDALAKKKEPAVRIGVTSIRWISSVEAEVRGNCRSGELGGTQLMLHFVKRNGRWAVKSTEVEVYS